MKLERESIFSAFRRAFSKSAFLVIFCLAGAIAISSCKKDDEEETKPFIVGDVSYDLPLYALTGKSFDLYPIGTLDPSDVTYTWVSAYLLSDTVKGSTCRVTIPDTLGTFSMTLTISYEGYYDKTVTRYVTSINPELNSGSLAGIEYSRPYRYAVDERDGQQYHITRIGNLDWFSTNLNWAGAGETFVKSEAMGYITGRLYTWNDATGGESASGLGQGVQGVCPDGWSIPTNEDWEDLAKALDNGKEHAFESNWPKLGEMVMVEATLNGQKMWPYTPDCTPANKFYWNALSGGNCTNNYNNYGGLLSYGFWWSSTEASSNSSWYRYLYSEQPDFYYNFTDKESFGASVRCVRLAVEE